jgi:hypothetical protein
MAMYCIISRIDSPMPTLAITMFYSIPAKGVLATSLERGSLPTTVGIKTGTPLCWVGIE